MRKAVLFIGILFISISVKSQVVWNPGFVKSLEDYFFIPVEFEHFGNWVAGIEKDSSLVFKKKEFTIEKDSLNLNFDLVKPGFSSPFNNSALSVTILGRTRNFDNLKEIVEKGPASIDVKRLPPIKVTTIYLASKISFDSTNEGKLLAAQTMKQLEVEFSKYFENKKIIRSPKNIRKRKHHPEIEKQVRFSMKENPIARFWINNSTFSNKNEIIMNIAYELN